MSEIPKYDRKTQGTATLAQILVGCRIIVLADDSRWSNWFDVCQSSLTKIPSSFAYI